jgi:predicted metalloprotease
MNLIGKEELRIKKEIFITLSQNLHPEQLVQFANEANHFGSYILIQTQHFQINAKSFQYGGSWSYRKRKYHP